MRLTGLIVLLVLSAFVWWGLGSRARVVTVPVLMYHRIGDEVDSPWWVTPRDFEGHLQALREQGYESIFPSDLAAHQRWGWPLPAKPVLITFDDGYRNVLDAAEPLLARYGFRGVCYLITGLVGDAPETRKTCEGTPVLIWPEVRAMQKRGVVRFGGHSRSHANLRAMTDPSGEISGCYRDLRKKGGFKPEGFCYPFGQFKDETLRVMARSGFSTAMTCEDGVLRTDSTLNLLALPRVSVMGGKHRFRMEAEQRGTWVLSKEGRELEVYPELVWKTAGGESGKTGLPPVRVSTVPVTLDLSASGVHGGLDPVLELWDTYHVVRYWVGSVPCGAGGR